MAKQMLTAGIDIGSNQVCCVAGTIDEDKRLITVLGAAVIPCGDGIKAGAVINIQEAAVAIEKAFEETQKSSGNNIGSVIAAIRGSFIEAKDSKGVASVNHSDKEITEDTIAAALDNAEQTVKTDPEHDILQIVPKEYILNQQREIHIQNPIGMEATFIEVYVHALVAASSNIGHISKAMNSFGAQCEKKVYSYLAASDILVTKEEKELGCLVVDFGGLTTGLVHYAEGIIKYTGEIPVGSDYITRDIMHKLRAASSESKKVKEKYGSVFVAPGLQETEFEYRGADGKDKKYSKAQLVEIIQPRVEQVLFACEGAAKKGHFVGQFLSGGIILTGGGSLLDGLPEAFEKTFGCAVRIGVPNPEKVTGPADIVSNPVYTAAIGAIASSFSNSYLSYAPAARSGSGFVSLIKRIWETF
jgi:cell division protein FtsA